MTITPAQITDELLASRGCKPGASSKEAFDAMFQHAGIDPDDNHAIIQIIIGRAEYWNKKGAIRHAHPALIAAAAFADGLLVGLKAGDTT